MDKERGGTLLELAVDQAVSEESRYDSGVEVSFDPIYNVHHYQLFLEEGIECRHVIGRALDINDLKGEEAFNVGAALKYLLRCGRKGNKEENIRKARNYLGYILGESDDR